MTLALGLRIGAVIGIVLFVWRFADHYYDRGVRDARSEIQTETQKKLAEVEKANARLEGELLARREGFSKDAGAILSGINQIASSDLCYRADTLQLRNNLAERANREISTSAARVDAALQRVIFDD